MWTECPRPWRRAALRLGTALLLCLPALPGHGADAPFEVVRGAPTPLALHPETQHFSQPLLLTHAGDGSGRRFVVEQKGLVRELVSGSADKPATFLDLRPLIRTGGERGLLGLAFHPRHRENGRLFVYYTDRRGDIVVAALKATGAGPVDPGTLRMLLTIANPATNHNGGMLAFGPDGYLYIGTGDGGGAGDPFQTAQNSYSHLGKILRIDVDGRAGALPYGLPATNPFVNRSTYRPEIWAKGLRNPWRFSFDRETGDLFIGDVGQDQWEEIDFQAAGTPGGTDFGWSHMEGNHCFPPNTRKRCDRGTRPVAEYSHGKGCSVTGGYVYRGQAIPALRGVYLFADYCEGTLWGLHPKPGKSGKPGTFKMHRYLETDLNISGFGEDEAGELYLMGHRDGGVYRIVPQGYTPPAPAPGISPTDD